MFHPREAWNRLAEHLEPLAAETVRRRDAAGRVTAQAVAATTDVPHHDVSAMDGYALALAQDKGEPAAGEVRTVDAVIAAGDPPGYAMAPGSAVRIMTGAPVPETADRVVPFELTDAGQERVRFDAVETAGSHIRRRAEVVAAGGPLFEPGTLLTDAALGVLASQGIAEVDVTRRPKVAMLTTGDEVVAADEEPGPGQLRDSHSAFFETAAGRYAESVELLGIARDDLADLKARIETGLESDVLLLTGGVSAGDYDLVEDVLSGCGCEVLFDAVAIQPGKPLVAATHAGGWVFGLPGNPASAMITFWLFVRPALNQLQGLTDSFWQGALGGVLAEGTKLPGARDRDRFLSATAEANAGVLEVTPHRPAGSHDLRAYGRGNAIVRVRAHAAPQTAGDCEVLTLPTFPFG